MGDSDARIQRYWQGGMRINPSEIWGVTLQGEAKREATVRAEPHPTKASPPPRAGLSHRRRLGATPTDTGNFPQRLHSC
jgi:hypothetical protein